MKRISISLILFALIYLTVNSSYSQPKFTIHIAGGYTQPLGDLKGDITLPDTDKAFYPFRMKNGFNFAADGKLAVGKKRNVRLVLGLNYNVFKNSADMQNIYYPNETVTLHTKISILTISLGAEYSFFPKKTVNPFVGADMTSNFWSGSFSWDNSGDTAAYSILGLKSTVRLGVQLGAGVDFKVGREEGLVVGIRYNMANLIGKKQYDASTLSSYEITLGDSESGIYPKRNTGYLQFYVGISALLGQPPKVK